MMEDISLAGVTTTESITSGGDLNVIQESAEIHQEDAISQDMMSEMSLPLPPSEYELKTSSNGIKKTDSGYSGRTVYADLKFEDFEQASKTGGLKLGPSFTDLDSLDVSCVDDDEMETKDNTSKDDDDNNATEAGNPTFHPLQRNERKETESKRRYNPRESTRNLLSEADDDDNDSEHSVVVRQPSVLIRRQPSSSGMVVFPYDPESKETLERLSVEHRSHSQLKRLINKELTKITRDADIRVQSLNGGLSYPAFLKGNMKALWHNCVLDVSGGARDMLFDDEIYMFNKNHLRFSSVVFQNLQEIISDSVQGPGRARTFGVKAPPKAPMLSGRAYLTNHRLILLSAEKQRGASVAPKGPQNSSYHLKAVNRDTLDFLSIPLYNIRGMELHASLGYSASAIYPAGIFSLVFWTVVSLCYQERAVARNGGQEIEHPTVPITVPLHLV
ncbi:hypothetical protein BSL78_27323 [Apostichopus japonicus]|uniref:Uncharacterized protein n=1 Tax=Stichopus japonicus TaxID=307972 RepID=A0A2G8JJD2_STIJA|nr:hypothetical protein BSL78_27323 [Apostichopus japonicus]